MALSQVPTGMGWVGLEEQLEGEGARADPVTSWPTAVVGPEDLDEASCFVWGKPRHGRPPHSLHSGRSGWQGSVSVGSGRDLQKRQFWSGNFFSL